MTPGSSHCLTVPTLHGGGRLPGSQLAFPFGTGLVALTHGWISPIEFAELDLFGYPRPMFSGNREVRDLQGQRKNSGFLLGVLGVNYYLKFPFVLGAGRHRALHPFHYLSQHPPPGSAHSPGIPPPRVPSRLSPGCLDLDPRQLARSWLATAQPALGFALLLSRLVCRPQSQRSSGPHTSFSNLSPPSNLLTQASASS